AVRYTTCNPSATDPVSTPNICESGPMEVWLGHNNFGASLAVCVMIWLQAVMSVKVSPTAKPIELRRRRVLATLPCCCHRRMRRPVQKGGAHPMISARQRHRCSGRDLLNLVRGHRNGLRQLCWSYILFVLRHYGLLGS